MNAMIANAGAFLVVLGGRNISNAPKGDVPIWVAWFCIICYSIAFLILLYCFYLIIKLWRGK
jgi:hypothetical protein